MERTQEQERKSVYRLKSVVEHLGISRKELSEATGVDLATISRYFSLKRPINDAFLYVFCVKFAVNPLWIETGSEPMMLEKCFAESLESGVLTYNGPALPEYAISKRKRNQEKEVLDKEKSCIKKKLYLEKEYKEKENCGETVPEELFLYSAEGALKENKKKITELLTEGSNKVSKRFKELTIGQFPYREQNVFDSQIAENPLEPASTEDAELPAFDFNFNYRTSRNKAKHPFFPAKEIESYTNSLENCLDRVDKIVINQVWEILSELIDDVCDENGRVTGKLEDVEGYSFPAERLERDIIIPAIETASEIIAQGSVVLPNGTEVPVTAEMPEETSMLFDIIDWSRSAVYGTEYITASKTRFRDIFKEVETKRPAERTTKEEKREQAKMDRDYMARLIMTGRDEDKVSQLTPMEYAAYVFLEDNFEIDSETCEINSSLKQYLTRDEVAQYKLEFMQEDVAMDDFLSVLALNCIDTDGCLALRTRMFSSEAIEYWNALHGYSSIIQKQ